MNSQASGDESNMKDHQKCLAVVAKAEADGEQLQSWVKRYRQETSDNMAQLRNENAQEKEKVRQLVSARDKALEKIREQNTEMAELKQKLEATADDSAAYKSFQPMLVAVQGKLQSAINEIGTSIDTFTKKNLCTELPGPESYNWAGPTTNYPMLETTFFPNNYNIPMGNMAFNPSQQPPQPPAQPNLYGPSS